MSKTTRKHTSISHGTKEQLAAAEARYREQNARALTMADLICEFRSAEILGPVGQDIFDRVVARYLDDWTDTPFAELQRTSVLARFARLWSLGLTDDARWFMQTIRALLVFVRAHHPEVKVSFDDLTVNLHEPKGEQ